MKHKILVIAPGFYPAKNYGGPVVSIQNFIDLLENNLDIRVITRNHELDKKEQIQGIREGWNKYQKANILYLNEKRINRKYIQQVIKENCIELLYINSIFDYETVIPSLIAAKTCKIKVLIAPRGELCKNALKIKKLKKSLYIRVIRSILKGRNIFYQSTSEEETLAIKKILGANKDRIIKLTNIPTQYANDGKKAIKKSGELKAIYVGRIHPKKNLLYTIQCLKKVRGKVRLDIYGPKEDINYWTKINNEVSKLPHHINVKYIKNLDHDKVIGTMSRYHCLLFHTLSENYGHVIAEAIAANCVPVISNNTPWNNIVEYNAGYVSSIDGYEESVDNIQKIIDQDQKSYTSMINGLIRYKNENLKIDEIKKEYIYNINTILTES